MKNKLVSIFVLFEVYVQVSVMVGLSLNIIYGFFCGIALSGSMSFKAWLFSFFIGENICWKWFKMFWKTLQLIFVMM